MPRKSAEQRQWEIQDAKRTLLEANKIKKNKSLYSAAKREIKKDQQSMDEVLNDGQKPRKRSATKSNKGRNTGNSRYRQ